MIDSIDKKSNPTSLQERPQSLEDLSPMASTPRRKRKRPTSLSDLCDDTILEILARTPAEEAIELRTVCKQWLSVIRKRLLPRWLPRSMDGFFYHIRRIRSLGPAHRRSPQEFPFFCKTTGVGAQGVGIGTNTPLGSLVDPRSDFRIVDCCNGMILYQIKSKFFVGNPATKSRQLLTLPRKGDSCQRYFFYLAFDPRVSAEYKVLAWSEFNWNYCVFSSKSEVWTDAGVMPGKAGKSTRRIQYSGVYCDGAVYVATDNGVSRFDLEKIECSLIGLPSRARKPGNQAIIGLMEGGVCYAAFSSLQLKVWVLEGNEWSLKYSSKDIGLGGSSGQKRMTQVLAFHPHLETVFLMEKSTVYSYDLKKSALAEVRKLGTLSYELTTMKCFPFSPCLIDVLRKKQNEGDLPAASLPAACGNCSILRSM